VDHQPRKNLPPSAVPSDFLADLYRHLPMLVVHLTLDGTLLHANPEVHRVTGYAEGDLVGKNFWAILFPGRLFAQVPKFISAAHPLHTLATDVPMTLRTREGQQRIIAWSRFIHEGASTAEGSTTPSLVCIGKDLTDRLLEADTVMQPARGEAVGTEGVDGEFVTPLAVSPPLPPSGESHVAAIEKVQDFLAGVDGRLGAITSALAAAESAGLAEVQRLGGASAAEKLLELAARAEGLRHAVARADLEELIAVIQQTAALGRRPGDNPAQP
jgi:PAS domain S-box-containing protein